MSYVEGGLESIAQVVVSQMHQFAIELAASLSDSNVWLSLIAAAMTGGACFLVGTWTARRVGILEIDAPAGETIGVGLGSGLVVLACAWAAVASGGRSSFTPVAIVFGLAVVTGARRRSAIAVTHVGPQTDADANTSHLRRDRLHAVKATLAAAAFVIVAGLVFGATVAPSPRDNEQPVEFQDEAFYSVLGRDLARTGTESIYSPSGFDELPGLPAQTWYHWGDIWLSAATISVFGLEPMFARHYVVLPLALLAAAALTGTLVRRIGRTRSRSAFLFGVCACLFLAPIPLLGTFFSAWPTGLIFGVTAYGLSAVAVLLVLHLFVVSESRPPSMALSLFSGAAVASVVPMHIVIALLGLVGIGGASIPWLLRSIVRQRRLPTVPVDWRRTTVISILAVVATICWGIVTGHGIGVSGLSERVSPFNSTWQSSIILTSLGAGIFLAIPIELLLARRPASLQRSLMVGVIVLLIVGAIFWGARLGDFTTFYFFYAGVAILATPIAAVAAHSLWNRARLSGRRRVAIAIIVASVLQLEFGVATGILRLEQFGRGGYEPFALSLLSSIKALPADARIAYACREVEELAFWNAKLISLDVHTGRHLVPMCFETDFFAALDGAGLSLDTPSPLYRAAPQRALYPSRDSRPTTAEILSFLKENRIDYIYADYAHPNSLVPDAIQVASGGGAEILRLP